jgi:hypothetical protein
MYDKAPVRVGGREAKRFVRQRGGVRDGKKLYPRSDEDLVAKADRSGIEEDAVHVDERVLANRNVPAIVAEERRLDPDTGSDATDELDECSVAPSGIGGWRCSEGVKKDACTLGKREQFGIA